MLSVLTYGKKTNTSKASTCNVLVSHKVTEFNLERFWNLDSIGINSREVDEDDNAYI